jgi:hypothetical protein
MHPFNGNGNRSFGLKQNLPGKALSGFPTSKRFLWFGILSPLAISISSHAQEAMRMSIASEEAAEARRQAMELDYCNLKWKSVSARIDAGMGMLYSDNVFYSPDHPQGDFAFRPSVTLKALVPITDLNSLYFSTGIGYLKYTRFDTLDSFYVTPDSTLQFIIYSGDFVINLHDRFSLTENGSQTPAISSGNNLGKFENTSGVNTTWDQNNIVTTAGADYKISQYTYSDYDYMNHDDILATASTAYEINRTLKAGVEGGGGYMGYKKDQFSNKLEYNGGPFVDVRLSEYISSRLSGGYVNYELLDDRTLNGDSNLDSFYARWITTHRVNRYFSHQLILSHNINAGTYYELEKLYSIAYQPTYRATSKMSIYGGIRYQTGQLYFPSQKTDTDWVSFDINMDYQWNRKFKSSVGYQFATRDAKLNNIDYTQNRLAMSLTYTF